MGLPKRLVSTRSLEDRAAVAHKIARFPQSLMQPARGLSIYFPPFWDPSAFYLELDFARRTRWANFLVSHFSKGQESKMAAILMMRV